MSEEAQGAASNGELSEEDAERMAAEFRPAWELDDAPFAAPAAPMPEAVVDSLAKTAPTNGMSPVANVASTVAAAPHEAFVPPPPRAPTFDVPAQQAGAQARQPVMQKTLVGMASPIGVPVSPDGAPPPPATSGMGLSPSSPLSSPIAHSMNSTVVMGSSAQAVPQNFPEPERPLIRSERPPAIEVGTSRASVRPAPRPANVRPILDTMPTAEKSGDFAVPRKSNIGMIIGISAAALAIVGVVIAVKFALADTTRPSSSSSSNTSMTATAPANTGTSAAQARKDDIPPPPPKDESPAVDTASTTSTTSTTSTVSKPPVLSQDIPVMKPASLPTAQATHLQPTPPTPVAIAPPPHPQATQHPTTYQAPTTKAAATAKPQSGGIVRDAPF